MSTRNYLLIVFALLIALPVMVYAQAYAEEHESLRKPATSIEDTWGLLDLGELINVCANTGGVITDAYQRSTLYTFRWPKSKGLASNTGDVNAVNRQGVIFGCKGNVIDSYSNRFNEDWQGVIGGAGKYYANDQPSSLKASGTPRMAHSDIPRTWPSGFFDSLKVWHPGPVGAYDALSSADQGVVLKRGAWFDDSLAVWRFWPGRFRVDIDSTSPTYKQQVPGQFAADREVYTIFNDRNTQAPDKPLGIQVEMQAYCYGRRFAQDVQFYDFKITNTSNVVLDSCSWAYLLDYRYGDPNQEAYTTYNTGINSAGYDNAFVNWDYNGATDPVRSINNGYFGSVILSTPKNMGVTDGHFFRMNTTYMPAKSKRNIWPVMISNPNDPALAGTSTNYFHGGANTHFDVFDSTYLVLTRWDFTQFAGMFSTSLFTLNPGESVRACIAFTAGYTLDHFKRNVSTAQKLFLAEFNGPSVPPSPKVWGVAGDRQNTLYWSDDPERALDIMTKKKDLEGYKIYRSQDGGQTWGKQLTDNEGRFAGYVPIAQFDKVDDIQGTDPYNNYNFLGRNTGLRHSWIDSTALNGVDYSYTITSYDTGDPLGLESYESSRGTTAADVNLVDLTPRPEPAGYQPPTSTLTKSNSNGKADIKILAVDPKKLLTQRYKIRFAKTPADSFYVCNERDTILAKVPLASDEMTIVDGFRVRVETDAAFGGIKKTTDETGKTVTSSSSKNAANYWFVTQRSNYTAADTASRTSDYEFRFNQFGSYVDTSTASNKPANNQAMLAKFKVPFQVFNVTNSQSEFQVSCLVEDLNFNGRLDLGEPIRIINIPYKNPAAAGDSLGLYLTSKAPYAIKIDSLMRDSLYAKLPSIGQSFRIQTNSPVTQRDTFYFAMTKASLITPGMTGEQLLGRIRVVPNPYIGSGKWEQVQNARKMQFTFLPPECTIHIFTVRGERVKKLAHTNLTGSEDWNLTNESGVEVAFGLYIFIVELPNGDKTTGKFAIIK